jgi:hypothetical protein
VLADTVRIACGTAALESAVDAAMTQTTVPRNARILCREYNGTDSANTPGVFLQES